jgi:hypothetical protein
MKDMSGGKKKGDDLSDSDNSSGFIEITKEFIKSYTKVPAIKPTKQS